MHPGAVVLVGILSLGLAACGDDDQSDAGATTSAPAATTPSTTTTTPPVPSTTTSPSTTTTTTASTTSFVPVEATVTGVVIAVEGNLSGIDWFTIRLPDGSDLTLVPADGLLFDEVGPLSHVRDHMVSGNPVELTYETSADASSTVIAIGDAGGGGHSHDE